jgi:hypothetical protein
VEARAITADLLPAASLQAMEVEQHIVAPDVLAQAAQLAAANDAVRAKAPDIELFKIPRRRD